METTNLNYSTTPANSNQATKTLICWRSIFTGFFVTVLVYLILTAFGAGIGGFRAAHIIDRSENGSGLFTGAAVWLGLASVVSLFVGSYFATRISTTPNRKIGGAHGVVISAIFFLYLMYGAGNMLGSLTQITGNLVAANTMGSPLVSDTEAESAARTFADVGWVLFVTFIVGTSAAILGGYEGSTANVKKPIHAALVPIKTI
jgi:hypothetical protein